MTGEMYVADRVTRLRVWGQRRVESRGPEKFNRCERKTRKPCKE